MGLMTPEEAYAAFAIVMGIVTLGFAAVIATIDASRRRRYLPFAVIPAVMAFAFWMTSQNMLVVQGAEGDTVPVARNFAYAAVYMPAVIYAGLAGGLSRRRTTTLAILIFLAISGITASWLVPAPFGALGILLTLASLIVLAYLMLGPYAELAAEQSGERTLLYGKLRNLVLLLWAMIIFSGLSAPQSLGLLDRPLALSMGLYIDLLATTFFGVIVIRARDAMDEVFEGGGPFEDDDSSSELPGSPPGQTDPAD